jgi:hypothetical protein
MGTSDLRIGNWLYESNISRFPMQVESIGRDWINLDFEGNESGCFEVGGKEIYPIPLNRELLERLGFKYCDNHVYEYMDDDSILFDEPDDWKNTEHYPVGMECKEIFFRGSTVIRCLYLHQLQNFFYCITNKELEINGDWL